MRVYEQIQNKTYLNFMTVRMSNSHTFSYSLTGRNQKFDRLPNCQITYSLTNKNVNFFMKRTLLCLRVLLDTVLS